MVRIYLTLSSMKNHQLDPSSDANRKLESDGSPIKNWGFGVLASQKAPTVNSNDLLN
jgi:hypothetical protein